MLTVQLLVLHKQARDIADGRCSEQSGAQLAVGLIDMTGPGLDEVLARVKLLADGVLGSVEGCFVPRPR